MSVQFSRREPVDTKSAESDRDVFNEKPSKEEVMAATQAEGPKRVSDSAIVHTTMGDIHIKLFPVEYVAHHSTLRVGPFWVIKQLLRVLLASLSHPESSTLKGCTSPGDQTSPKSLLASV